MNMSTPIAAGSAAANAWLKSYYFARAAVAFIWVGLAFTVGRANPFVGITLLVIYPALDAVANLVDAERNGGLRNNRTQAINAVVSGVTAIAVSVAAGYSMNAVLGVFGAWALLAGVLQFATGARRWKTYGAQWTMMLSGLQSAIAGCLFIKRADGVHVPSVTDVAPYAAFGAFYFLVSAVWMTVAAMRARRRAVS